MMKGQGPLLDDDTITPKELAEIIRNHDVRCQLLGKEYLLLIKEEANHRCLLLASDCQEAIWSRPLDIPFFMALRKEMHLTTTIQILADHFVRSLEQRATLQRVRAQLRVTLQMRIGDGIMMASSITIDSRVHFNNPDDFKPALRRFILYMWEVKSAQLRGQVEKEEQEKKALELKEKLEKEEDKSKSLFVTDSKAKRISLKHRDLVNPQRKKRKKNGAKLGLGYEQRTPFELPQDFDL